MTKTGSNAATIFEENFDLLVMTDGDSPFPALTTTEASTRNVVSITEQTWRGHRVLTLEEAREVEFPHHPEPDWEL